MRTAHPTGLCEHPHKPRTAAAQRPETNPRRGRPRAYSVFRRDDPPPDFARQPNVQEGTDRQPRRHRLPNHPHVKKLGVGSVAVYSKADQHSLHVAQADEAVCIGEAAASESYLVAERILEAAKATGADAIHPGYGFLSENADFARACEAAGIAFIGPTPEQMLDFGLKHTARELAEHSGVPLLPGTGLLDSVEAALAAAAAIGYPVMLKSTAGGGGIGMQLCYDAGALKDAYGSVKRLSQNNFSNNGIFLEKYVEQARHIEVQLFGDGAGKVIALGERDCSLQRRNQKVVEETPAPNIPDGVRAELLATAERLGRRVNYRSAGTVEFIFDAASGAFYFLR
nr:biotin carboxylase N-terminal domain-containing protein [Alkalilimnicola ehrlichii]